MGNSLSFALVHGLAIAGFVLGLSMTAAKAKIDCREQSKLFSDLFEQGFTNIAGGVLRGEAAEILPQGSTAMLMVNPVTKDFRVLVTRPDVITCVYLQGVQWEGSDK